MTHQVYIRQANVDDWDKVIRLAWVTFLEFEAKDYGPEGVRSFRDFLVDEKVNRMFLLGEYVVFVAELNGNIVGLISLRSGNHISLLFVDKEFHHQKIGSRLLRYAEDYLRGEDQNVITVDSAPYALNFYRYFGYDPVSEECVVSGIRYTPMAKQL